MRTRHEHVGLRDGAIETLERGEDEGVGVRVRVGGAWGFAAAGEATREGAERALARALEVAATQPPSGGAELAPEPPARGERSGPCEEDPFEVSLEDKLELLTAADAALRAQPGLAVARSELSALSTDVEFASTEGALFRRRLTECGGGLAASAVNAEGAQVRSWPASHGGSVAQAGFEHVRRLDLPGAAPRVAEEAVALLTAPDCPSGPQTLVLAGEQLGLQLHESVGHAVELDRVLGREASYAGTSFVSPHDTGSLRYGSELMNVTADGTSPGGLGTLPWDDEGVEGQAVPIVREGVLRGFLSSRETAAEIGLERSGRLHARRRLRPPAAGADDQREPRAGPGRDARGPDRRHRERHPARHQPLVVDRLAAAPVPVRRRGRVGDPRRPARAPAAQPLLRGDHAALLGLDGRGLLALGVAPRVGGQLRQGRARPGGPRLARVGARALPRGRHGRGVSAAAELAERALAAVPGDREALAHAEGERSLMLRFARSRPTQSTAVADISVEVAVVCDGHVGRATTNAGDDEALAACGARAAAAAEAAARAGGAGPFPGFATGQAPRAHGGHDRETARLDPATGAAALETAFAAAREHGVEAHGIWTVAEVDRAVASSAGATLAEQLTDAFMKVVCIGPTERSGYASAAAMAVSGIDPEALAARAAALAAVEAEPAEVQPGELPVVFEPAAVGELLDLLGRCAFNGLLHAEGQGALTGRLGTRVAAPAINLSDSPRFASTLPRSFDAEGTLKAPMPLIQDGVAHGVVHDITSATSGRRRARRVTPSPPAAIRSGPAPTNLVLVGGGAADAAELAAPIERGPVRDAALVRERGARRRGAGDRRDPRRHLPDRGRGDHASARTTCD